jgi:hypothetical protein
MTKINCSQAFEAQISHGSLSGMPIGKERFSKRDWLVFGEGWMDRFMKSVNDRPW